MAVLASAQCIWPTGMARGCTVLDPDAGTHLHATAATGELLGVPALLEDVEGVGRLRAEVLHERTDCEGAALVGAHQTHHGTGVNSFEETDEHSAGGVSRAVDARRTDERNPDHEMD
ncbi:hypothetical protein [Streptomyces cyaneofuscatus]|uniref:hypothetical protein n=1 Tax=Streptomyces cyaneofuscatus TaxID=66883 RepID=UPI0037F57444